MDVITLAVAKKYTKDSLKGAGALKGAPCTVKSTSYDADGNSIVVLEWSLTDGSKKTSTVTIKKGIDGKDGEDGRKGETGVSIVGAHFNSNGKIVFELSDGSETAPVSLPSASVDISPDSGNIIEQRANGIFVPETDTSNFVEKEENKGLISDEEKAQIATNKNAIDVLNGDESVVGSVAKQIAEALGKLNSLSKEIVDVVPSVADAKDNVIYLLKGEGTTYEMYSLVSLPDGSKNMAPLGSTEIDLDGYLTETKAKELYLALADVDQETLAKLGTVTESEVIYLTFNGSKILTLSQIESIVYKKSEIDDLLDAKLDKSAVVKTLDSTKTDDEVPSAKAVFDELEGKIDIEQGSVNAGKALIVGEDGKVKADSVGAAAILTTEKDLPNIDKSKLADGQMVVTPDEDEIIDDSSVSGNKTWSSEKISANLGELSDSLVDKVDKNNPIFEHGVTVDGTLYVETAGYIADSRIATMDDVAEKADKSYVDDNFATMDKVTTVEEFNKIAPNDTNLRTKDGHISMYHYGLYAFLQMNAPEVSNVFDYSFLYWAFDDIGQRLVLNLRVVYKDGTSKDVEIATIVK